MKQIEIITHLHDRPTQGHQHPNTTIIKIFAARYWWLKLHKDVYSHIKKCHVFQVSTTTFQYQEKILLQSTILLEPFQRWGLDFVRQIRPTTRQRYIYILDTNYTTKLVEAKLLRSNTAIVTTTFIYENIITLFGCPWRLFQSKEHTL